MKGPPFLKRPEEEWPKFEEDSKQDGEEWSKEMLPNKSKTTKRNGPTDCATASAESSDIRQPSDTPILEHLMKTCSTCAKARKTLAYVLRFVKNTRKKENNQSPISPQESRESELRILQWCQQNDRHRYC